MKKYVLLPVGLLLSVLGVALVASDEWVYIDRFLNQPENAGEWPDSFYTPTYDVQREPTDFFPPVPPNLSPETERALEDVSAWSGMRNTEALVVVHQGRVLLERYWNGIGENTPYSGRGMTKSLIGILYGFAVGDGDVSLDEPVSTYVPEWRNDARSGVLVRHLLENTSGLENPPFGPSPLNKQTRLAWGPDIAATAVSFQLADEPGTIFNISNANSIVLALVLERATGVPPHEYFDQRLWKPLGATFSSFYAEHAGGRAHMECCFRATPRDWARLGYMLAHDGVFKGQQILPSGWVKEMTAAGQHYPPYGLHIWTGNNGAGIREVYEGTGIGHFQSEPFLANDMFFMEGGSNRVMWVSPALDLVILRLGLTTDKWDHSFIPNTIIRGMGLSQENEEL
ncbi:MAG: serine hydrolase [Rhodospirillaceae bacterium]